jgi:hypothetical protein
MLKTIISEFIIITAQASETPPPVLGIPSGTGVAEEGDLFTFVANIVRWSLGIIGIILFIIIILAGFNYATAGGDSKKTEDAISTIRNAIIGLFIIGFAFVVSNTVLGFIFNIN